MARLNSFSTCDILPKSLFSCSGSGSSSCCEPSSSEGGLGERGGAYILMIGEDPAAGETERAAA